MLIFSSALSVHGAQPVLQRGYDAAVTGANLSETTLNTSNVAPSTFGLLFKLPVDDAVFAQPLYVPNVAIAGQGTHNVVYVATMSDSLYAFDADSGGAPLWSINLATRVGAMPVQIAKFVFSGARNIVGNLGILSTPVIDLATNTIYLVACTLENNTMVYRLHAVDITSGAGRAGSGVMITGSFGGSIFDARYQTQRVSLALSGNQVVFGFGAEELEYAGGYVGWVMAYDKTSLQQSGVFATVTTGTRGGGVWQAGRPPMVDSAGYVYVFVGNGYTNGYDGVHNFSESVLKLDPAKGLALVDWFTPGNWSALDAQDLDLSSSGPLLVPGTSLLAGGGKTGDLYVLNTANLGKFNSNDSQVVQKEHISASMFKGGPVYWQRSAANGGPLLYNWGELDAVKAYAFNGTKFAANPSSVGTGGNQITPGGILTLSANGEQHGSGVLWATIATSGNAEDNPPVPGALHAFDAENLTRDLWNSSMVAARDGFGNFAKFVPPLVVNGRVYVATWSNQVAVYGLFGPSVWASSDIGAVGAIGYYSLNGGTVTVNGSGADIWGAADAFQFVYQALTGDGSITARVVSQTNTNSWAKAGVMIRETLTAGSRNAIVEVTPGNGAVQQARTATGGTSVSTHGALVRAPYWVRLARSGNTFTGYVSPDGASWTQFASYTITMASQVYAGLAVTSHANGTLGTAVFDNITIASAAPPPPDTMPPSVPARLQATSVTANSITLGWSASSDNPGGSGVGGYYIYSNGNTGTPYATVTNGTSFTDWGLTPSTTYTYQVAAFDKATPTANVSAASTPALSVTTLSTPPPSAWTGGDIGSVGATGYYSLSSGTFTVNGSGADIWGTADAFQFVSQTLTGDGSITARVVSQTNTNSWAKAGVMFREALTAGSTCAVVEVTPGNGAVQQARTTTGGTSVSIHGTLVKAPYWVRLVRSGNTFTGFISPDGASWSQFATYTITMASQVYAGLAVTSHANGTLSTAVFDNVTVQ